MHGVTTALVAFLLAGVIWPHIVKHKVQFYAALITILFIILLDSAAYTFFKDPPRVIYGINGLLQVAALVLCILSSGLSFRELGGEVFHTIDVVRRGGEKETIIVPLRGEQPKPRDRARDAAAATSSQLDPDRDIAAEEAALDAAERAAPAPAAPPGGKPPEADRSIPLEP
jgi:hypothetical protein